MPFKSKAQQRFMFARHPKMAKRWADETPSIKKLPEKVKKSAQEIAVEAGVRHILRKLGAVPPPIPAAIRAKSLAKSLLKKTQKAKRVTPEQGSIFKVPKVSPFAPR